MKKNNNITKKPPQMPDDQNDPIPSETVPLVQSSSPNTLLPPIILEETKKPAVGKHHHHNFVHVLKYSLGGGLSGSAAMACQVSLLMWMRTVMNYQYRFVEAGNFFQAFRKLYSQGGFIRMYRGYPQAMVQAPLSRFGDAAANEGVLLVTEHHPYFSQLPVAVKTVFASGIAAFWRLNLMPIDAWKTIKQVEGKQGTQILLQKIRTNGIRVLYHGMGATFAATLAGHYPWFATYNYLSEKLPKPKPLTHNLEKETPSTPLAKTKHFLVPTIFNSPAIDYKICDLGRQAFIGFAASIVSDSITNSLRVIKTVKQTSGQSLSYMDVVKVIGQDSAKSGTSPLFGTHSVFLRGLGTRITVNGLQGLTFSVLWKVFMDLYKK